MSCASVIATATSFCWPRERTSRAGLPFMRMRTSARWGPGRSRPVSGFLHLGNRHQRHLGYSPSGLPVKSPAWQLRVPRRRAPNSHARLARNASNSRPSATETPVAETSLVRILAAETFAVSRLRTICLPPRFVRALSIFARSTGRLTTLRNLSVPLQSSKRVLRCWEAPLAGRAAHAEARAFMTSGCPR